MCHFEKAPFYRSVSTKTAVPKTTAQNAVLLKSLLLLAVMLLQSCAMSPPQRLQATAQSLGFEDAVVSAAGFDHRVFRNGNYESVVRAGRRGAVLHVYLEGDGTPWRMQHFITSDPTPRFPMMLRLMALDQRPAIYLGRPCYNGFAEAEGCSPAMWTSARYSPTVVDSMAMALSREIKRIGATRVTLFGHSGGGALALLMAARLTEIRTVVTLAGNLNIDAWTTFHGYTPLYTSLNPALQPPLAGRVRQFHLLGMRDRNIPPSLVKPWVLQQRNAFGYEFRSYDHACCWEDLWPLLLRQVDRRQPQLPGRVFKRPSAS